MSANSNINNSANPWNGLRTYYEGEVIYGRSEEIHVLSLLILQNHQTVVYGRSGIGKSSILNAGIFPLIRKHGVFPVYVRFEHNVAVSYLDQIKNAISREIDKADGKIKITKRIDKTGEESLWEFFHRIDFHDEDGNMLKPMVVFDQFEEIFTLENNKDKVNLFFRQLADLINNVMPEELVDSGNYSISSQDQDASDDDMLDLGLDLFSEAKFSYKSESDYHLVFTLREDFLSYLERNTTDIPELKNNRYCLQPINDEQAAEIIMQPRPGLVDTKVAKLIIEKVTGEKDFEIDGIPEIQVDSAILSLYLSRLHDKMIAEGASKITSELVEAHSDNIIEDFYHDAISNLPKESVEWMEDTLINNDGRRDNRDRSTVIRGSGLSESQLDSLINDIKLLRQFSYGGDLRIEYIHDVLCPVIVERRRKRKEDQRVKAIEDKAKIERRKSRSKILAILLFFAVLVILVGGWLYRDYYLNEKPYEKFYREFSLIDGWPVGVGDELTSDQKKKTPLFYRLSKKGHKAGPFTDVEVMSSNSMLPSNVRIQNWPEICKDIQDHAGMSYNEILSKVKNIHFSAVDYGSKVEKMELKDENGNPLMLMSYFHLNDREAWLNFTNINGQPQPIRDNGIDRVKMSWDSIGRIEFQRYYTSAGVAKPIHEDKMIAGFLCKYPRHSLNTVDYYTLNIYGLPNTDLPYNLKRISTYNDTVVTSYFKVSSFDDYNMSEAIGDHGYSRVEAIGSKELLYIPNIKAPVASSITEYDRYGNPIKQTIMGAVNDSLPPIVKWDYKGNTGLLTKKQYLTIEGLPYGKIKDDIYKWEMDYDDQGNIISEQHFSKSCDIVYSHTKNSISKDNVKIITEILNDKRRSKYITIVDSISEFRKSTSYYGDNGIKINLKVPFWADDSVMCHIKVIEDYDNHRVFKYFDIDDEGIISPIETNVNEISGRSTSFCRYEYFDDNGNIINMEILDADQNIATRMMYFVQGGETIGRAVWGIDDTPVRCPRWEEEGFGYYKIYFSKDFDRTYVFLQPFDEWMNNSLFSIGSLNQKVTSLDLHGKSIQSADGSFIGKRSIYKSFTIPMFDLDDSASNIEMPFLHILSKESQLYKLGLKDGDRIIKIGSWHLGDSKEKFVKVWDSLMSGSESFDMDFLRPTADGFEKISRIVKGDPYSKLNSEYHFFNLSKSEKSFYEKNK